ncbi:MAG: DUF3089 domain-containing protein [Planctomycetes bacterium]|nr:DUF3089 domain-containing protein [Planctomycetota bacterium]
MKTIRAAVTVLFFAAAAFIADMAGAVDYSDPARWISRPSAELPVDVIYLYPTAWQATASDPMYCEVDNPNMVARAKAIYETQASAYETVANVYAPFYQQMNIAKTLGSGMPNDQLEETIAAGPALDVTEALDYYFANCNNGRPFILAGHSQGTQVMMVAMTDYFTKHPELRDRMVASYLVGYSVTDDFLADTGSPVAAGADDPGVVVSWNTEAPGTTGSPVLLPGAHVITPINWATDATYAGKEENLGAFLPDADGVYHLVPNFADAWIDPATGALNTGVDPNSVDPISPPFPSGSFHGYDYQFYYANLRQNVLTRSLAYLNRPYAALYSAALRSGVQATRTFAKAVPSFLDRHAAGDGEAPTVAADAALSSPCLPNRSAGAMVASPVGRGREQTTRAGESG